MHSHERAWLYHCRLGLRKGTNRPHITMLVTATLYPLENLKQTYSDQYQTALSQNPALAANHQLPDWLMAADFSGDIPTQ